LVAVGCRALSRRGPLKRVGDRLRVAELPAELLGNQVVGIVPILGAHYGRIDGRERGIYPRAGVPLPP
jgi:hypothetical protein